jgi:MYXO-CTERM domain-containing protein
MAEERDRSDANGVDRPHDVLAADEFGIPTSNRPYADPHTGEHEAHDVLAADEFAMPTRSGYRPDPHAGEHEAHDVLAADEFAMPGGAEPHGESGGGKSRSGLILPLLAVALALIFVLRRRI